MSYTNASGKYNDAINTNDWNEILILFGIKADIPSRVVYHIKTESSFITATSTSINV